jgi:glycosyltransferase involved in cell wall biosynthesis
MKICLVCLRPLNRLSGQFKSIFNLAHQLREKNIEVTIYAPNGITSINSIIHTRKHLYPLDLINLIKTIRKVSSTVDIVQLHLPTPSFAFIGDFIKFKNKSRILVNFESHLVDNPGKILPYIRKSPNFYISRLILNNPYISKLSRFSCEKYIVSSLYQKVELQAIGLSDNRIKVIPNVVTGSQKYRKYDKAMAKESIGFNKKENIVTYIGHFTHIKGVEFLVEPFSRVLEKFPETKLVLAWSGRGSPKNIERVVEKRGIKNKTMFFGKVNVTKLLSASDVFVLPYVFTFGTQCFPNLLLEAFSVGVPIVTSDIPPIPEVVTNGETGLLVPPADSEEIAEAVINLLSNEKIRSEMMEKQRKVAKERFDSEKVAQQYIDLYKEVLNG